MRIIELLSSASSEELKQGYIETDVDYTCLLCGRKFEKGIIYKDEDIFYEAGKYMQHHIENEKQLRKYFPEGSDGPIRTLAVREKHKLIILREIANRFESSQIYSEKEVNEILKTAYVDYVALRRYMIEYGFMERKPDGSQYWLKSEGNEKGGISYITVNN